MTDKPTPKEIENLFIEETGFDPDDFPAAIFDFARAVLAKWGQPAQETKGRKVFVCTHCDGVYADQPVTRCDCLPDENTFTEGWICFGAPAQAQAVAVPLTCEWTHNEDDGFWETACGEAWRFDDGGPGENNMHFCHSCGNSLRIKGGQHGTE